MDYKYIGRRKRKMDSNSSITPPKIRASLHDPISPTEGEFNLSQFSVISQEENIEPFPSKSGLNYKTDSRENSTSTFVYKNKILTRCKSWKDLHSPELTRKNPQTPANRLLTFEDCEDDDNKENIPPYQEVIKRDLETQLKKKDETIRNLTIMTAEYETILGKLYRRLEKYEPAGSLLDTTPERASSKSNREKRMGVNRDLSHQFGGTSPYSCLDGLYVLHDELGSGGFGKVKLATHLLTGQKVAIKIIDKKAIGDDLPRVKVEMEALRHLSHQNICRLFQYIETEEKFFIVMEYCSGGEMFDYIVKKERLEESEARHFFRQLVQAMAYVHQQGFAHRDLKPENLLLTDDLHLKVIDFGLCARPDSLTSHLATCCGSPAYAAPELIQGKPYKGNEADVWSMGVLLYTLLCGSLPFEDENMQTLYRKIARGAYFEPEYLSPDSRSLLRKMLQVVPESRITLKELLVHPWLNKKYSQPIKWNTIYDRNVVDEEIARELAFHHKKSLDAMVQLIKEWKFDYLTATYYILLQMKRRGLKFALPPPKHNTDVSHVISSPTIHASLGDNLDRSGLEDSSSNFEPENSSDSSVGDSREIRFAKPLSPDVKKQSYLNAMMNVPSVCTGRSPQQRLTDVTPLRQKLAIRQQASQNNDCEKENYASVDHVPGKHEKTKAQRAASVRVRGPVRVVDTGDSTRPRSIYSTPQRGTLKGLFSPGSANSTNSHGLRARSSERTCSGSPASVGSGDLRTPRSITKTPRLRQRVFASLERKADRVINLLTPRKVKNESPQTLKTAKGLVNVSITSSRDAERVKDELMNVFEQQGMKYECNGWKISARQKVKTAAMTVELEIVFVESLGYVGIKRKRLAGDAFLYKKVCEQILMMAGL